MTFKHLVQDIMTWQDNDVTFTPNFIPHRDFENWRKQYTWDALQNQRYGQSFCNHFCVQDHRLYYERDWQTCDNIIRRDWLAKS